MSNNNIDWNDVIKKEARGINDADLEEYRKFDWTMLLLKLV